MKKTTKILCAIGAILLVLIGLLVGIGIHLGLPHAWHLGVLLEDLLRQDQLDGSFSLQYDGQTLDGSVFRRRQGDEELYGCTILGIPFYYGDETLILENGRAYDLDDLLPEEDPELPLWKLLFVGIDREKAPDSRIYRAELERIQLGMSQLTNLKFSATERTGQLSELSLGLLWDGTPLQLTLKRDGPQVREIPSEVWRSLKAEQVPSIQLLGPLLHAFRTLPQPLCAELDLKADCGPIQLTNSMMLYGTQRGIYLERRSGLEQLSQLHSTNQALLAAGYLFLRDGRMEVVGSSGSYGLIFPAEQVQRFCTQMVPELEQLPITYEDSSLILSVKNDRLQSVSFRCGGQMPFLFSTLPVSLGLELTPIEEGTATLPPSLK